MSIRVLGLLDRHVVRDVLHHVPAGGQEVRQDHDLVRAGVDAALDAVRDQRLRDLEEGAVDVTETARRALAQPGGESRTSWLDDSRRLP